MRLTALLLLIVAPAASADTLVFPSGAALALDVTVGGNAPEATWAAFLDRLFDHFDRDADGALIAAEYDRVFALPLADGRALKPVFPARDGKLTRAAFRARWREAGFAPVVVTVRPAPDEALRLGHALFAHLDRDGSGSLSPTELRQATALLRRLDEDEDEVLTAAELLATAPPGALPPAGVKAGAGAAPATLCIREKTTLTGGEVFHLSADGARLTVPGGSCLIAATNADTTGGIKAVRGFTAAQFDAAAMDGKAPRAVFADDPTAQVLAALFDPADRNGDGTLTRAELDAFFDLIEAGVSCRVGVTVTDRGRNLFDVFDHDGDGRLDLDELTRTRRELPAGLAVAAVGVPVSYRLAVAPGTTVAAFGPVPLGAAPAARPVARPAPPAAPRWFAAMDRNRDGFVSVAEFSGPPAVFTKLDRDADGRISPAEAAAPDR